MEKIRIKAFSNNIKNFSNNMIALQNSGLITCPECGNHTDFVEVADGAILTTRFIQNNDGSFSQEQDDSQILGEVKFFCGECSADLTDFHQRFVDMLF